MIDLHLFQECTFDDIGDLFDTSASTARKRYERTLRKLRDSLNDLNQSR